MIGQKRLKAHMKELVESGRFPSFSMIVAPKGHGKKELAQYVIWMLGADCMSPEDLKVDSIRKIIEDGQSLHNKRVYLLADSDDMTPQAQNALLKFSEEPPANAYIIMTVEDQWNVLATIQSRAKMFKMDPYTKEELERFTDDPFLLDIAENPGQIEALKAIGYDALITSANKVIENIGRISASNAFSIMKHFFEEHQPYIVSTLISMYAKRLYGLKIDESIVILEVLKVLYHYKSLLRNKSINKSNALEMMFIEMREKHWSA